MRKILLIILLSFVNFGSGQDFVKEPDTSVFEKKEYTHFSFHGYFSVANERHTEFTLMNNDTGNTKDVSHVDKGPIVVPNGVIVYYILYFMLIVYFLKRFENKHTVLIAGTLVPLLLIIAANIFRIISLDGYMLLLMVPTVLSVLILFLLCISFKGEESPGLLIILTLIVGLIGFLFYGTLLLLVPPLVGIVIGYASLQTEN